MQVTTGELYSLNETGSYIYQSLADGKDSDSVASNLLNEFDIQQSEAFNEVQSFSQELIELGALEAL